MLGADLREQMQIYRRALDAANHPQDVKDNCLRWCSYDWVGVTVAETEEKALEREKLARAETMAIRTSYVKRHGPTDGPAMKSVSAQSRPDEYAKGGDMKMTIAGTPDTIAAKVRQLAEMAVRRADSRGRIPAAEAHGIRAIIGKVMMDRLTYDERLPADRILETSLRQSADLCARWHGRDDGRLQYAFTPRWFVSARDTNVSELRLSQRETGVTGKPTV